MTVIQQTAAEALLSPYLDRLRSVVSRAEERWSRYVEALPDDAADLSRRSQANVLYDYISRELVREFAADRPWVRLRWDHGFLVMTFHGLLALRVKKFVGNRFYRTSGVATQQRLLWEEQSLILDPQIRVTHAVLGYFLDEFRRRLHGVAVACRNGRFLEWVIELPDASSSAGGTGPVPMPLVPSPVVPPVVRPRAQPHVKTGLS